MQLLQHEWNGVMYASIPIAEGRLSDHVEKALRLGTAAIVLPLSIVTENGSMTAQYQSEPVEPLSLYIRENRVRWEKQGDRLLGFARDIVNGLFDAEMHFLPLDLFSLRDDTVLADRKTGRVYLLPDFTGRTREPENDVKRLRSELSAYVDAIGEPLSDMTWKRYRERFSRELLSGDGGLRSVLAFIEQTERELYRLRRDAAE